MKKETKELIDWIKKQISLAGTIVTDVSQPYWQQDRDKAIQFLDSLPEIESHLCRGGYIQDKNGTPCCDGDKVKCQDISGRLFWDKEHSRFLVEFKYPAINNKLHRPIFQEEIEKVEE